MVEFRVSGEGRKTLSLEGYLWERGDYWHHYAHVGSFWLGKGWVGRKGGERTKWVEEMEETLSWPCKPNKMMRAAESKVLTGP